MALACSSPAQSGPASARLTARPGTPTQSVTPGTVALDGGADGYLVVPSGYTPSQSWPLVVALHGAGIGAEGPRDLLGPYAEERGFILLAVRARAPTWDAILGGFGPDIVAIDRLLRYVFDRCVVDIDRIMLEGFSDGASYALSVGLVNGDLFSRVVAFSPGFIPPSHDLLAGKPRFFISHGREDPVLSFVQDSAVIVPALRGAGYDVTFFPFNGFHSVPTSVAREAVDWFLGPH